MTLQLTIYTDEEYFSGDINGKPFNKISKETFLEDLKAKIDKLVK